MARRGGQRTTSLYEDLLPMHASDNLIAPRVRTMQIIAAALMAGVVMFLGIVAVLILSGQHVGAANPIPVMSILPFVMLAGCLIAMVIVGRNMQTVGLQKIAHVDDDSDLMQLLGLKQTILIVTLALFEGPALFGCIALLLERQFYVVAVPLTSLVGMALNFPTEGGVRNWLETNARRVLELRQLRSLRSP
jgi:hypothetical protein